MINIVEISQKSRRTFIEEDLDAVFKKRRSSILVLPSVCRQVLDLIRTTDGCLLGGGAALELYTGDFHKIKDWDIFSQGIKVVDLLAKKLRDLGFENTKYTEWGETFEKSGVIVQLITKYYAPDPQYLFDAFDLSTCCFASNGRCLYYTAQASEDVAEKKISRVRSKNPISAIKRIARYGQKGYMPTTQAIKEVLKLEASDFDFDEEEDYES